MTKKLNKMLFIYSSILGILALGVMLGYCIQKGEQNLDTVSNDGKAALETGFEEEVSKINSIYEAAGTESEYLCIPLDDKINQSQVTIENDLMKQRLTITISKMEPDYFYAHKLWGNKEKIDDIFYTSDLEKTSLIISYTEILEYESNFENDCLNIKFVVPRDKYDKIVVIDPSYGGSENGICTSILTEKEVTLDIALRLKELLDKTDIKVYYTRLLDENKNPEQITKLVNGTKADMFLSIYGAFSDSDSSLYGITTYYNDTFFIPGFSSSDFAYLVEEKVSESASAKALALEPGKEDMYLVKEAQVPVALVEVGYFSNKQESRLLSKEDYRDRIAKGLYDAIIAAYGQLGMDVEK